jgi:hypothetical protein
MDISQREAGLLLKMKLMLQDELLVMLHMPLLLLSLLVLLHVCGRHRCCVMFPRFSGVGASTLRRLRRDDAVQIIMFNN